MGYMKIKNLYKDQTVLLFKQAYALEKCHGTSAHISWNDGEVRFFSGGENHQRFKELFNVDFLSKSFLDVFGQQKVVIYGEAYGGKQQGMSKTYGPNLAFIVFDVKIDENWLEVPNAENVACRFGLEFVPYHLINCDIEEIDKIRLLDSEISKRRGILEPRKREGIVLRPLIELSTNNGERIIAKHKNEEFQERKNQPDITDPEKLKILEEANAIAEEWVVPMRLQHVLDKLNCPLEMENTREVIVAMINDIVVEGAGEFVDSKEARTAISKRTAVLFKRMIKNNMEIKELK